jgi:hypothetical protein
MKRPLGFNSRIGFLSGMIAVVLGGCLAPARAAGPDPKAKSQGTVVTDTERVRGAVKTPRQQIPQSSPSSSTSLAGGRRSARLRANPRSEYNQDAIAVLRQRLDRQEKLLAAQQEQIAMLIVAVDELKKMPNRPLLASYEPGVGAHGIAPLPPTPSRAVLVSYEPNPVPAAGPLVSTHAKLFTMRGTEALASPASAASTAGELPQLPPLASLQSLMATNMATSFPAAATSQT